MDLAGIFTLITLILLLLLLIVLILFFQIFYLDEGCGCITLLVGIGVFIFWILPWIPPFVVSVRKFLMGIINGITSFIGAVAQFLMGIINGITSFIGAVAQFLIGIISDVLSFLPVMIFLVMLLFVVFFLLFRLFRWYEDFRWRKNSGTPYHEKSYVSQEKAKIGDDGEIINNLKLVEVIKGKGTQVSEKIFLEAGIYSLSCKIKPTEPISVTILTAHGRSETIKTFNFSATSSRPLIIELSDNYVFDIQTPNYVLTKWELHICQR